MPRNDAEKLNRKIDRLSGPLPKGVGKFVRWLRGPTMRAYRFPVGILLIVGGLFGFLPILGFWMIPLGLILLSQDLPFLRAPLLRFLTWLEQLWVKLRGQQPRA